MFRKLKAYWTDPNADRMVEVLAWLVIAAIIIVGIMIFTIATSV